jgi:hypothetical protein
LGSGRIHLPAAAAAALWMPLGNVAQCKHPGMALNLQCCLCLQLPPGICWEWPKGAGHRSGPCSPQHQVRGHLAAAAAGAAAVGR